MSVPTRQAWIQRVLQFGWGTILIGAVAMAATYPGRTHGIGMVTEPLLNDLDLKSDDGRVFYASLNLWGTLIGALFCIPAGWLLDRYDRRWILAGNLILLGVSVLWMSYIHTWQELLTGIILTRGFGQSALSVVSLTIVAKSFTSKNLGLAMAFYSILFAPFHLILIKAVGWALTDYQYDWRSIWGCVGLALVALSAIAFFLRRPEPPTRSNDDIALAPQEPLGATLWQALATPAFWLFSVTIALWSMIYSGVALFNVDIFRERGFDQSLYFNVLACVTVVALGAKFFFGWLVNYVPITWLLGACLVSTSASLFGLPFATYEWQAYCYGVGLGIASGSVALLFFATWGKLYGQRDLGRIQGVAQMMTVFASASGPLLISSAKRATTSYALVFHLLAGFVLLMAIAPWLTPLPRFKVSSEETES